MGYLVYPNTEYYFSETKDIARGIKYIMKGETTMKSLGIVRKIDELGRLVLPIETRRALGLSAGEGVEIFVDADRVILKKYEPACIFCGDADDVIVYAGKKICRKCAADIGKESL